VLLLEVIMPNITISINDDLLHAGREYAKKQKTSLNALIRRLLERTVTNSAQSQDWLTECFQKMDKANGNSNGMTWKREDLYDV
jgi:hypothetical protein